MTLIRDLAVREIPAVVLLIKRNYPEAKNDELREELFAMFGARLYAPKYILAVEDGKIVGIAGYHQTWMDARVWSIFWVNVDPDHQSRGIGKLLVNEIIARARAKRGVELLQLTTSSSDYYRQNFGFSHIDTFGPKHRHLMVLKLI